MYIKLDKNNTKKRKNKLTEKHNRERKKEKLTFHASRVDDENQTFSERRDWNASNSFYTKLEP
jgi:hypothetical protein